MPGVVMSFDEKLRLAEKIMEFGTGLIDIMPVVSDSEFRVTKELVAMFGDRVSATCRAKKADINTAIKAGASRVTMFAPLSDIHIKKKLGTDRETNLERAIQMIDYARKHGLAVDFAGEDSSRADYEYFKHFVGSIQNLIKVFFVADTVGCLTPEHTRNVISHMKKSFSCPIGIHTHNDFGMATANTVEAALSGADYLSGTFTGIGERAGNAPIEEVCISLKHLHGKDIGVRYEMLKEICDMVQEHTGVEMQKHKPVVGEHAFAHESGVHVDGVMKSPETYESFKPESVGHKRKICIGKHSGSSILRQKLGDCADIEKMLEIVKTLSEINKDGVTEEEIGNITEDMKKSRVVELA